MSEKDIVFLNIDGSIEFCEYEDLSNMEKNLQILEKTNLPFKAFNPILNVCSMFKGEIVQIKKKEELIFTREE
jgi:hypothetical protein